MTMDPQEILAKIEDPAERKAFKELADSIRTQREHYGLSLDSLEPPTLAEMKEGDRRNCERLIAETVLEHSGKRDLDEWLPIWYRSHIHDRLLPDFAYWTVMSDCWEIEEEHDLIHNSWSLVEWPAQMGIPRWRELFERAGFWCNHEARNEEPCPHHPDPEKPSGTLTVYRGSFASDKRGLSWTLDRDRAEWFVARGDMAGRGRKMRLWRCEVPAERQYGHYVNRGENEIVADVRGLRVERA